VVRVGKNISKTNVTILGILEFLKRTIEKGINESFYFQESTKSHLSTLINYLASNVKPNHH